MKKLLLLPTCTLLCCWAFAQTYVNLSLNQAPMLVANAGMDQLICPGDTAGLGGTPVAMGGTPGYTYNWSGSNLSSSTVANPMANPSISGDYFVLVTDSLGCSAWDTVTVTIDTCVGISDPAIPVEFAVVPNPNAGQFKALAVGDLPSGTVVLRVLALNGQLVEEREVQSSNGKVEETFSLPLLSGGVYHVQLQVGDYRFVRKMVVQK